MARLLIASTVSTFLEAFMLPYARHFRARGWRVDAMARGAETSSVCRCEFDRVWDIAWTRNPLNPFNVMRAAHRVASVVEQEEFDIVHVHTPVAAFVSRFALRHCSRPAVIYTAHGFHFHENGSPLKNACYATVERLAGKWTDYVVVINHTDEVAAMTQRIVPPERLMYMPGIGLDTNRTYTPAAIDSAVVRDAREQLAIPDNAAVFLMIAEFNPGKRHRDALYALAALDRPDVHLLLAGTGPLMQAMRALAQELGIAGRVHFLGFRSDIPVLLRMATALLLCSDREGLPRSIMEAMAMGIPVIGSDVRGTRELLADRAGYLYKLGDVQTLAQYMASVLDCPADAAARARSARERIAAYDIANTLRMHEELYARAVPHKAAGYVTCP